MNDKQKQVLKLEYKPRCFVLLSGAIKNDHGTEFAMPVVSFFYDAGDIGTEWSPPYGPIQRWCSCDADAPEAREHYFYNFENSPLGSWSQIAVEREDLPGAFASGNYDYIFSVLKEWASR